MNRRTEFSFDEIIGRVDTSLKDVDQLRSENLEKMAVVQQANNKALERERQRLSNKYGENHPRVKHIDAKLQFNQGFNKDLQVEIEKSKIQVPKVDQNTWLVHGRVLDRATNQGIPGLTVALVNQQGQWVRELGYACTDERGYFAIVYSSNNQSPTPEPTPVFLRVSDSNQRVLYRASEPLTVQPGRIVYREIFLSEDDVEECPTPPDPEPPSVIPVEILALDGPNQLTVNQSGTFTARVNPEATPPLTYRWNFGDKATASTLTATHAYANAGTYTVTFAVANPNNTDCQPLTVKVVEEPKPPTIEELSTDPTDPIVNTPVRFSATVQGDAPISYSWKFGDGSTSTEVTPSHVYQQPGNYTVTLKVKNDRGSNSRSGLISVSNPSTDAWIARGRIVNEKGEGLAGLVVSLFDRDCVFDDRLGTTQTDRKGEFMISYGLKDFQDVLEGHPDLYIKVMDNKGKIFYSSENTVRCEAGQIEVFNITLSNRTRQAD